MQAFEMCLLLHMGLNPGQEGFILTKRSIQMSYRNLILLQCVLYLSLKVEID